MTARVTTLDEGMPPDASDYRYALVTSRAFILANTATEIVAELLDGYGDLPEGKDGDLAAFEMRLDAAVALAGELQTAFAREAEISDDVDFTLDGASDEILTVIKAPRESDFVTSLGITEWEGPFPLVLVTAFYAPYDSQVPPTGSLVYWVDPSDELRFLKSLAAIGVAHFMENENVPADEEGRA